MTAVSSAPAATPGAPPAGPTRRLTVGEWATVAYVGGLLVLGLPDVSGTYWSPKVALVLIAIVPGVVALGRLLSVRDRAAVAGTAFIVVAALATVLSPSPRLALVGLYIEGTGFLFVVAVVGAWALGRQLSAAAGRVLGWVVLAAAVANAVMCWLQMSSTFSGELFTRVVGRAPGMLGNPVHTTAFLVGAFALAMERAREVRGDEQRATRAGYIAACALFASAVQLSGGRIGIVLLALVLLRVLVRSGWRTTAVVTAVTVLGVIVASSTFASGSGAAARLAGSDQSTFSGRLDRWATALPAIADRPVLGIGPGLYRRATSPHATVAAARAFGADALYQDGHDLLITYAVTTGLLGLAVLAVWLAIAGRHARGELAWFTLFAALSLLVQPQFIGLTPVLALTLGAAAPRSLPPPTAAVRALVGVGLVVGLLAATVLLRGDLALGRAVADASPSTARRAERLLPMWSDPPAVRSRIEQDRARVRRGAASRAATRRAVAAARTAVHKDPSSPGSWLALADLERGRGHREEAARAYRVALGWNPQSADAFDGLQDLAAARGDAVAADRWCRRFLAVVDGARCAPVHR